MQNFGLEKVIRKMGGAFGHMNQSNTYSYERFRKEFVATQAK